MIKALLAPPPPPPPPSKAGAAQTRTKHAPTRIIIILPLFLALQLAVVWVLERSLGLLGTARSAAGTKPSAWPLLLLPPPILLTHGSSLWAVGRDARMSARHYSEVPIVSWSDAAVERVTRAWRSVQFRDTCDRVLYMTTAYDWGVTSQIRDYTDLLIVSALSFNRTLVLVDDAPRPKWCAEDAWLECFFEPLSTRHCAKTSRDLGTSGVRFVKAWPDVFNGTENISRALGSRDPALQLVSSARFVGLVNDTSYFPAGLWRELWKSGDVVVRDSISSSDGAVIRDMGAFCATRGMLCHTLALSALRTMLSHIVFRPRARVLAAYDARVSSLLLSQHQHGSVRMVGRRTRSRRSCVAVHLRWTDKADDGGQARVVDSRTSIVRVQFALQRLNTLTHDAYRCALVMTDDDQAVSALQHALGGSGAYEIIQLTNVTSAFASPAEYALYRKRGHRYVQEALVASLKNASEAPCRYYDYYTNVIADIWAVASAADYLIGVGSSGVSQLTAQLMGARHRADGNIFAIWQEDVVLRPDFEVT